MPIETEFKFEHARPAGFVAEAAVDVLGPLRGLVGSQPASQPKRTWSGTGFNMIWRPNFDSEFGTQDFFLELNLTDETLSFLDLRGANGVATWIASERDIPRRDRLHANDQRQFRR